LDVFRKKNEGILLDGDHGARGDVGTVKLERETGSRGGETAGGSRRCRRRSCAAAAAPRGEN